jgi:hypothetical protein
MELHASIAEARTIMERFAQDTGLVDSDTPSRRYLWTDAFAACNFLELFRQTGTSRFRQLAIALVDDVHEVLAKHREDDNRTGWISGLSEAEGRARPLAGGLRIGKPLPERPAQEPFDERAEWDQDGQYYHYLTKWMHALKRMGSVLRDAHYGVLAVELAHATHRGFLQRARSNHPPRLAWKMSIDLSYPLVPYPGHHDPLDGLVTFLEIGADLDSEIIQLERLCEGVDWSTTDPLGIGCLLFDASRLIQLHYVDALIEDILNAALDGLSGLSRSRSLQGSAAHRLAFRELGLTIGLHAFDGRLAIGKLDRKVRSLADDLRAFHPLCATIEEFWLEPEHRCSPTWQDHADINDVMLATSMLPDGFLSV